jgi:gliding motility-associated-like protein
VKIRSIIYSALFSLISLAAQAQSEANVNNVWYFGDGAGLDFNAGVVPDVLEDGELDSFEGCASVSNTDGELLFYASSNTVYRSDHQVMTNGFDIYGSESTIQSVIIVPSPADDGIYYLFSLDTDYLLGGYTGLSYSVIDMNQWGGFGAVTEEKNIQLTDAPLFESLTAVKHANGTDVWVLTQLVDTLTFEAYLVTEDGIITTPVQSDASVTGGHWQGAMKVSPEGTKVAAVYSAVAQGQILDFNSFTGELSNGLDLELGSGGVQDNAPYGVEFSPSGERLYISHLDYGPITQYDLTASDIPASRTDVGVNNGISGNAPYSSLQLAPNGVIYAACYGEQFLSQINQPDELAPNCAFVDTSVVFTEKTCKFGLPQFVQKSIVEALFSYTDACKGDTVYFQTLTAYDSLLWDFGDPASGDLNFSTDSLAYHVYEEAGTYTVTLEQYVGEITLDQVENLNIPGPTLSIEYDLEKDTVCTGDQVKLTATTSGEAAFIWDNDSSNPTRWVTPPGIYWVRAEEALCTSTDTLQLYTGDCAFMRYPNIITPNNDGVNDTFLPVQQWYVTDFEIKIYDRWGLLVYSSDQWENGWDGNDQNGKEVADGVYFYMINYNGLQNENKTINSTVQVTRTRTR